jgi:hypothetical protein
MYSLFRRLFISSHWIGITGLGNFRLFKIDIPCRVSHRHPNQCPGRENISHSIRFGPSLIRIRAEPFMKEALRVLLQHSEHNAIKRLKFISRARGMKYSVIPRQVAVCLTAFLRCAECESSKRWIGLYPISAGIFIK